MAAPLGLKPGLSVHGSCKASFRGLTSAFQKLSVTPAANRRQKLCVQGEKVSRKELPTFKLNFLKTAGLTLKAFRVHVSVD